MCVCVDSQFSIAVIPNRIGPPDNWRRIQNWSRLLPFYFYIWSCLWLLFKCSNCSNYSQYSHITRDCSQQRSDMNMIMAWLMANLSFVAIEELCVVGLLCAFWCVAWIAAAATMSDAHGYQKLDYHTAYSIVCPSKSISFSGNRQTESVVVSCDCGWR